MTTGFATAFSEITLVLFTTLAPSGAVAYVLMSLPIIRGRLSDDEHLGRRASVAALLVLAGIFVMRFSFYMMHMTVGISL